MITSHDIGYESKYHKIVTSLNITLISSPNLDLAPYLKAHGHEAYGTRTCDLFVFWFHSFYVSHILVLFVETYFRVIYDTTHN